MSSRDQNQNKVADVVKVAGKTVASAGEVSAKAVKATLEADKEGLEALGAVADKATDVPPLRQVKKFWRGLGPGLTTGSAGDDPSGITTYSQTGAKYGFQLLWIAAFTFPLMSIVQEMCARIGLQTGRGLAANIRQYFPPWILYIVVILVLAANSFNIGANLGALAKAAQLLWPAGSFVILVIFFTLLCLLLEIFISYEKYAKYLKYLALILGVYVITALVIKNFPWYEVLRHAILPSLNFSKDQIILICGILGTTISPYLFFWQTSQEVEEKKAGGQNLREISVVASQKEIRKMRLDVWLGMLFSNLAMFFIIAVCGAVLFPAGITNINTAAEAAAALKPLAGNYASLLFALGIFGVGLLGVPVLAGSASYAVSESFGWKEGLNKKLSQAKAFYGVIIFSMLIGLAMNFIGLNPIKALIWAAIFNGLVAPVVLVLIVLLASSRQVMGRWVNRPLTNILGWVVAGVMIVVGLATIYSFF